MNRPIYRVPGWPYPTFGYTEHRTARAAWQQAYHNARCQRRMDWGYTWTMTRTYDGDRFSQQPITRLLRV